MSATKIVIDCTTGEATEVEMTGEELAGYEALTIPEIVYGGSVSVDQVTRTTDDQPTEVVRLPTEIRHVYRATFQMTGIDAQNGVTRDSEARMTFKRTGAGLAQVGATAILYNAQDPQASSWAIVPSVQGTDLVISVRGALGRTIDWLLVGAIGRYTPDGWTV